ncbi:MAG: ABC transporter permease [Anaerolineae bacterium]
MKGLTGMIRIFRYELMRNFRRRGYLFMTFGVPVLAIAIYFGITAYQEARANQPPEQSDAVEVPRGVNMPGSVVNTIGVVDLSGTIDKSTNERLILYPTEAEAKDALDQGNINYYYLIAADYLQTGKVGMYFERITLSNVDNGSLRSLLTKSLVDKSGKQVDPRLVARLQSAPTFKPNTVNAQGTANQTLDSDSNFAIVYIFALVLLFAAFTTSGYLMQSVVEEKENRMVEVLLSSVRPRDLLFGKVLALSLLGILQMGLWFGAIIFIIRELTTKALGGAIPLAGFTLSTEQIVMLAVYFVLGYLYFAASYAAIGALATNMREGPQLAAVVTLPAAVPMWATTLFATAPNGPVATTLSMIPFTSPLAMVMRATVTEVPLIQFLISAALLLLTVIVVMWLAARFFRVNVLLSGQLPKFRDLLRLVTEKA